GGDAGPRLARASPLPVQCANLVQLLADRAELRGAGRRRHGLGLDVRRFREIVEKGLALWRPGRFPHMLGLDPILGTDREFFGIGRGVGIALTVDVGAHGGTSLRRGPELVPLPLRTVVLHGLSARDRDLADTAADVDVSLRPERLQIIFDARVLRQRLDERADAAQHHRPHLVFELRKLGGRKALVEPVVVRFEVEFRLAHQKIRWAKAAERSEPAIGTFQISLESIDVWRPGGDDAPTENTDPLPLCHGGRIVANPVREIALSQVTIQEVSVKRAIKPSVLIVLTFVLCLAGCRWGKSAAVSSTAPTTQTIAPAAAQPAVNGTDAVTQTVDVEDGRSEDDGGVLTNPQTAKTPVTAKKPAKTPPKKHK